MPQEINKENVRPNILYKVALTKKWIKGFKDTISGLRTDGQRMKQQGLIEGLELSLTLWESTAELFGIEIPTEDEETTN